jgi:hypothetical protein
MFEQIFGCLKPSKEEGVKVLTNSKNSVSQINNINLSINSNPQPPIILINMSNNISSDNQNSNNNIINNNNINNNENKINNILKNSDNNGIGYDIQKIQNVGKDVFKFFEKTSENLLNPNLEDDAMNPE